MCQQILSSIIMNEIVYSSIDQLMVHLWSAVIDCNLSSFHRNRTDWYGSALYEFRTWQETHSPPLVRRCQFFLSTKWELFMFPQKKLLILTSCFVSFYISTENNLFKFFTLVIFGVVSVQVRGWWSCGCLSNEWPGFGGEDRKTIRSRLGYRILLEKCRR